MSLLRYNPFTSVFDSDIDHRPFFQSGSLMSQGGWKPIGMLRSHEDETKYVFHVDVPGVSSADLKIVLVDSHYGHTAIHLRAERQFQSEDGTSFESSSFERQFSVGPDANQDKIAVDLKDGVLAITIPKKKVDENSPTYIPITSGAEKSSE